MTAQKKRKKVARKDRQLTFLGHLEELRGRIIKSAIFLAACCVLAYGYVDQVMFFLIKPIGKVIFTSPGEAFSAYLTLALFGGIFLAMPVILYQTWQFVSAGLTTIEQKYIFALIPFSIVLFFAGSAFGYFIMLPLMMKFFLSFSTSFLVPMVTISKYISFIGTIVLSCGLIFELPLAIIFLTKVGIITPDFLIEKRKYAVVGVFIVSAVLTPSPDCISQVLMAIPLLFLYEISVILAKIICRFEAGKANENLSRSSTP